MSHFLSLRSTCYPSLVSQMIVAVPSRTKNTSSSVKGGEKPDQRAEQNTATAAVGVRWSEGVGIGLGAAGAGNGPCVREERSTDIRRCKSPIRNWGRAEVGVLRGDGLGKPRRLWAPRNSVMIAWSRSSRWKQRAMSSSPIASGSGRTVPAGRRPRSASAFAELQSIAKENRRMWKQGPIVRIIYLRNARLLQ